MTPEQQAAYINAQVALAQLDMLSITLEMHSCLQQGMPIVHLDIRVKEKIKEWGCILGHNPVLSSFTQ